MKIFSKKIVLRKASLRIVALLCCLIGTFAVWNWKDESNEAVFKVQVLPLKSLPPNRGTILENRNLSNYEHLSDDFLECDDLSLNVYWQCEFAQKKLVNFVKDHLKNKKLGYALSSWCVVDVCGEKHIFIEPDENKNWQIVVRWERPYSYITWNDTYTIETINASSIKLIRNNGNEKNYKADKYYIIFLDAEGKEILDL